MTNYNIRYKDDYLAHAGKKGMKWGFNDGKRNGKRTADITLDDLNEWERAKLNPKEFEKLSYNTFRLASKSNRFDTYGRVNKYGERIKTARNIGRKIKNPMSKTYDVEYDKAANRAIRKLQKHEKYKKESAKRRERYNDEILVKNILARQEAKQAVARAKRRTKVENAIKSVPKTVSKKAKKAQKWLKKRIK